MEAKNEKKKDLFHFMKHIVMIFFDSLEDSKKVFKK